MTRTLTRHTTLRAVIAAALGTIALASAPVASARLAAESGRRDMQPPVASALPVPKPFLAGTFDLPPELEAVLAQALTEPGAESAEATHYAVTDVREMGGWRIISVAGLAGMGRSGRWNIEDHGVWFGLALAHQGAGAGWTAAVQGSAAFSKMLADVPSSILPDQVRAEWAGQGQSTQALASRNIQFPWQPGTNMLYGMLGVHTNGFAGVVSNWQAVDFLSDGNTAAGHAPNMLHAAAPGAINYVCRDSGEQVSFKVGDLFYTHLVDMPNLQVGRVVSQGEALGSLKTGTFDMNCGHASQNADWFHVHWGFPSALTLSVDGWALSYTAGISNWVWTRSGVIRSPGTGWLQASAVTPTQPIVTPRAYLPLATRAALPEARALWISRFDWCGTPPCSRTRLEYLINKAADAHFNIIMFQTRATGDAYYTPGLEPWSYRLTSNTSQTLGTSPGWDPLAVAVQTAHGRGLQLHAYVNMYSNWECGRWFPPNTTAPLHPFWSLGYYQPPPAPYTYSSTWRVYSTTASGPQPMSVLDSGAPVPCSEYLWSSPGVQRVNEQNLAVIKNIVSRYAVDGVHMDRVRYPGPQFSTDPESLAAYTAALATTPGLSYGDWQRDNLSRWMTRIYTEVKAIRPQVKLSAAVWFTYKKTAAITFPTSQGYYDYYQDSHRWLTEGALDAIAPMIYGATFNGDYNKWRVLADDHTGVQGGRQVWLGIGAAITSADEIGNRIAYARGIGARGIAIWSAGTMDSNQYWDDLAAGPFRNIATAP